MKSFPILGAITVKVKTATGIVDVGLLSCLEVDQLNAIIDEHTGKVKALPDDANAELNAIYHDSVKRLCELLGPKFPAEIAADLYRLAYPALIELGYYLQYGDNDQNPQEPGATAQKKSRKTK